MGRRPVVTIVVMLGIFAACSRADDVAGPASSEVTAPPTRGIEPTLRPAPWPSTVPSASPSTGPSTGDSSGDSSGESTGPPAGSAPPASVPPATGPIAATPTLDFSEVSAIVDRFVDDRGLNGAGLAIVHRDHGLVHHEHWGEFDGDRVSLIASSGKMIAAGVLMRLHDDGLLDVDAPVAEVAEWGAGNPDITPVQLLSNSSGLVGLGPDPAYPPYVCQWSVTDELERCAAEIFTTTADDGDVIEPDTGFRYGGAQWQVAGAVAEAASGRTWGELIEEIYVEPCGVESLGFGNHFAQLGPGAFTYPTRFGGEPPSPNDTGNPNIEGGAYINSGDYAELLLMHLRGGRCDGGQVLSAEAVERTHADRIGDADGGSAGGDTGYGLGWWIDRTSGRLTDPGAYGSVPWLDLQAGRGGYLVLEADARTGAELAALLYQPIDDVFDAD